MRGSFISLLLVLWFAPALSSAGALAAQTGIEFTDYAEPSEDTWVAGIYAGGEMFGTSAGLDRATEGALGRAIAAEEFSGEEGTTLVIAGPGGGVERIVLVGMGAQEAKSPSQYRNIAGSAVRAMNGRTLPRMIFSLDDRGVLPPTPEMGANLAFGARLAAYRFDRYWSPNARKQAGIGQVIILTDAAGKARKLYQERLAPVAKAIFMARDLVSEPSNVIYPESFVERVRSAARGLDVEIETLNVRQMKKLNMGALLGVGQGSERPPRLLILRYDGGKTGEAPIAFVGKGITFDSGGISLKDKANMWRMKYDMGGAASAVGTILALAGRKAKVNAVGIAALAENMPSGTAQRPGDVVTTMSGITIEIWNTDAEGRLVLADAVWYAQARFQPRLLVDIATLTGSVRRALGAEYAGLFSRQDDLAAQLLAVGDKSGEPLWRLPLHPAQRSRITSDIADIKNSIAVPEAGASIGAQVIGTFVAKEQSWAHLDIAGVAWSAEGTPTVPVGASGYGIRLLDQLVEDYYETE